MTITVFSNIANTHNDPLFAHLRSGGTRVRAYYHSRPEDLGRTWTAGLDPDDRVTGNLRTEWRALRDGRGTDVVLTGGYASPVELLRRVTTATVARPRTLHWWGERLRGDPSPPLRWLRRAVFAGPGLTGILAVGSRAVPTYRGVTRATTPIHTFPYVTDRGLLVQRQRAPQPTIGFAGRFLAYKGLDLVLDALADLPPSDRPVLEVAGDGPERSAWQARARRLDLPVTWLGPLAPDALDARRATWWLQVVPAHRSEGWGLVVQEALNSGVPVLASGHVHAATDLIRPGENGSIVTGDQAGDQAGDPIRTWAEAIGGYLDPARVEREGDRARRVGRAFAPAGAARWLAELLERAAAGDRDERSFVADAWAELDRRG